MSINFTSKNVKFTGALKAYTEKQLKNIEKISGDIISAEIIVAQQKFDYKVEITLKTKLATYHVEEKDEILKQTLRKTLNIIKSQAKKNKEKLRKDKKRLNIRELGKEIFPGRKRKAPPAESAAKITVLENFSRKPYSVEEAIFFLTESGENAFMFINAETNKISVVFYNRSHDISIIEAN
jgi:putative sigma-54 modulation protein